MRTKNSIQNTKCRQIICKAERSDLMGDGNDVVGHGLGAGTMVMEMGRRWEWNGENGEEMGTIYFTVPSSSTEFSSGNFRQKKSDCDGASSIVLIRSSRAATMDRRWKNIDHDRSSASTDSVHLSAQLLSKANSRDSLTPVRTLEVFRWSFRPANANAWECRPRC